MTVLFIDWNKEAGKDHQVSYVIGDAIELMHVLYVSRINDPRSVLLFNLWSSPS